MRLLSLPALFAAVLALGDTIRAYDYYKDLAMRGADSDYDYDINLYARDSPYEASLEARGNVGSALAENPKEAALVLGGTALAGAGALAAVQAVVQKPAPQITNIDKQVTKIRKQTINGNNNFENAKDTTIKKGTFNDVAGNQKNIKNTKKVKRAIANALTRRYLDDMENLGFYTY